MSRRMKVQSESGRFTLDVSDHAARRMKERRELLSGARVELIKLASAVWDSGACRALVRVGAGWLVLEETGEGVLCVKTLTPKPNEKDRDDLYTFDGELKHVR